MLRLFVLIALLPFIVGCSAKKEKPNVVDKLAFMVNQIENTLKVATDPAKIPRTILEDGSLKTVGVYNWTSGFFAGNLWHLYVLTGDEKWKQQAIHWTEALDTIQYWSGNHDVGFMIYCSYGNGLRFAGKKEYEKVIVQTARSLSRRYSDTTRAIKSWNYRKAWDGKTEWFYPVIIDNMMNLELLFEASLISGDDSFRKIAIQHAETTMKNHYRDDYSSYHVVDYDTLTGAVLDKATCQGFTDASAWARGQAWGFYGYVLCYRYTKDKKFLTFAENIANYILHHPNLPADMVPLWDYNVIDAGFTPEWEYDASDYPEIPRDASAAAIICSALYELAGYSDQKEKFLQAADKILTSLLSPEYMGYGDENKYFILDHSVGSIPHGGEIDVPLVYADYYLLEAMYRSGILEKKH